MAGLVGAAALSDKQIVRPGRTVLMGLKVTDAIFDKWHNFVAFFDHRD